MSETRLSLFFAGTQMTVESMATLLEVGVEQRSNLHVDPKQCDYHHYHFFDGVAAPVSSQHPPVENMQFDVKAGVPVSAERSMKNSVGFAYRFVRGSGTDHLAYTGYHFLCHQILSKGIRKIDLIGFSRGAHIALLIGSLLNNLRRDLGDRLTKHDWNNIEVKIFAIDPVAGTTRNHEATKYGKISPFVKLCIVGLATNESLPGFDQRDILSDSARYNLQFHPVTKYLFLPFPEDHLMCMFWMRDIIRAHLPENSPLLKPCNHDRNIKRLLGSADVKWDDYADHTFAYRLVKYVNDPGRYSRRLIPYANCRMLTVQIAVETCFKFLAIQQATQNVGHVSLQNEADSDVKRVYKEHKIGGELSITKSLQEFFAKNSDNFIFKLFDAGSRVCKRKLSEYTNPFFINLFHEAMFKVAYPRLYDYIALGCPKGFQPYAKKLVAKIPHQHFPSTHQYVHDTVSTSRKFVFKPLKNFEVTNIHSLESIFLLLTNAQDVPRQQMKFGLSRLPGGDHKLDAGARDAKALHYRPK